MGDLERIDEEITEEMIGKVIDNIKKYPPREAALVILTSIFIAIYEATHKIPGFLLPETYRSLAIRFASMREAEGVNTEWESFQGSKDSKKD